MSNTGTINQLPLDKKLRNKLERTVKDARDVSEEAALAACKQLGVGLAKADSHLTEDEKDLRRRLRIHGRQLGDLRDPSKETQELDRLVEEIAYQHWHRMLFARFLAENHLLMYPDPDDPVSVSLDDCEEMAADEHAKNGWELAARFATKMLPQIFRIDSPVFSLDLPPERQQQLEKLLSDLDDEVFKASDSLGWVYQFWQAKRKDEVNRSEVKIGARELPAVTQLFTEPYMVSFLLDNSLGAWWAARRLTEEDLRTATSEQELRDKAALPGVPLDYLRFVRTDQNSPGSPRPDSGRVTGDEGQSDVANRQSGPWTPAAGTFDAWPESLAELKTLDPCCGSGHFLAAALLMLTPMRMTLEDLSAREAIDCVLNENLHGLEIDQRCVELAAFALALAAWRYPEAGGYRKLPNLNVACCGLSVGVSKDEWKAIAKDNKSLRIALDWLYDAFKDAPVLGSLINPLVSGLPPGVNWPDISRMVANALEAENDEQISSRGVVAQGLSRASLLLGSRYHVVTTNVPFRQTDDLSDEIRNLAEVKCKLARANIATIFFARIWEYLIDDGVAAIVHPQGLLYKDYYSKFREQLFGRHRFRAIARLGPGAFHEITGEEVKVCLIIAERSFDSSNMLNQIDATSGEPEDKAVCLATDSLDRRNQSKCLVSSKKVVGIGRRSKASLLEEAVTFSNGIQTGDYPRFGRTFWEIDSIANGWALQLSTVKKSTQYGGREHCIYWQSGNGELVNFIRRKVGENSVASWVRGLHYADRRGVAISAMGELKATLFNGELFDDNTVVLVPNNDDDLGRLWAFCSDVGFNSKVRRIDQSNKVRGAIVRIEFDQPPIDNFGFSPYSDDSTQWIFHGHPASSTDALQVAVARLLGYRWPAELDADMELATDARQWIEQSTTLTDLADEDGIVCIPAVRGEQAAEDRLLNLLHLAYEQGRGQEQVFREKLEAADGNDPVTVDLWRRGWEPSLANSFPAWRDSLLEAAGHTGKPLESWLRDKFFTQHCKTFHNRPFIWHIWDGEKDGFSALVNYHKLDNKTLESLIYLYLNDWISKQKKDKEKGVDGSESRLAASENLKTKLETILKGESPHDIFVRWKPIEEQPIGWNPDLNDGVRLNIRPWMTVGDVKKKGAGVLRDKPNIHWKKDRGKDVESAPWYHLGPEYGGKGGDRINDHHLTLAEKKAARGEQ
ncbi:BREX-1 system adenine-specific DNA-methyltransferase PglX [Stieleria sp. ICT_E10.1]|uniref:BREX-1 system adenine-specific DNA-methyltransferase PglX n=1 Tax=Stieleria sedimenti TaxID=2976331 RepID=UPI0021807AD6|nr:BREX-1 system adenine-specific DNA-methyltransferase PglX [Stieleria sedimenti]MCS7466132.1 BREX-1 system adenine-specific DNA-methyltransferase PglX [Stieleria sedimenti]